MGRNDDIGDMDEIESIQDALFAALQPRAASPAPLDALAAEAQADCRAGRTTPMDAPADAPPLVCGKPITFTQGCPSHYGKYHCERPPNHDGNHEAWTDETAHTTQWPDSAAAPSQPSEPTADDDFDALIDEVLAQLRAELAAMTAERDALRNGMNAYRSAAGIALNALTLLNELEPQDRFTHWIESVSKRMAYAAEQAALTPPTTETVK